MNRIGELLDSLVYWLGFGIGYVAEWAYWMGQQFVSGWRDGREAATPGPTTEQQEQLDIVQRMGNELIAWLRGEKAS